MRTEWARMDLLQVSQMPNWQICCNEEQLTGQDDADSADSPPQRFSLATQISIGSSPKRPGCPAANGHRREAGFREVARPDAPMPLNEYFTTEGSGDSSTIPSVVCSERRRSGEIGIRSRLKICRASARGGSSPPSGIFLSITYGCAVTSL